tara:strand:- start:363 stop:1175 length:813 start_codon:yes stop_codon:yes gene_type:complete
MKRFSHYIENSTGYDNIVDLDCLSFKHIIVYGSNSIDNYCYILNMLKKQSKSQLKYSRRIAINFRSEEILFNISDIHVEVDFDLLGVSEYNIFLELFRHVTENVVSTKKKIYIVCINFKNIKQELLSIFYTFLNTDRIHFIFSTTNISFICDKILQETAIKKIKKTTPNIQQPNIEKYIDELANFIMVDKNKSFFELRELLYKILVFNIKIHDFLYELLVVLIKNEYIVFSQINNVLKEYTKFVSKYNNNYRPIYHIESYIVSLINLKND